MIEIKDLLFFEEMPDKSIAIKPRKSLSALNAGLDALHKLSMKLREDANDVTAPPQDETDFPKHDVAEALLNCADELDRIIEEMSN